MRKPIIAVTGDYDPQSHQYYIKEEYIQAISLAGGLPVVLYPSIEVPKEWSGDRRRCGSGILRFRSPLREWRDHSAARCL